MLIAQRLASVAGWVIAAVAAAIIADYLLRFPSALRLTLLVGGVAALGYSLVAYLWPAIRFQPSLTQLALRVERVLPAVAGRLASSVEFAAAGVDQANPLAARSIRETQTRLAGESMNAALDRRRTRRDLAACLVIAAAAGAIAASSPSFAAIGLERLLLPYTSTRWPARTGVDSLMGSVRVHARGQALALRANVTRGPQDQRVDAHYRLTVDGVEQPWQDILLTHQGGGVHERLVDTNAERIEVYFGTDDDETPVQRIDLAPPPAVRRATLTVEPPAYAKDRVSAMEAELGQGLDDRAVTDTPSLVGSSVRIRFELNKPLTVPEPLSAGWLKSTLGWDDTSSPPELKVDAADPSVWLLSWMLTKTQPLSLRLTDEYGLSNPDPIAYRIEAIEDRPPTVAITRPQADQTVLPNAVIGLEAEGRDDVALDSLGLQAKIQPKGTNVEAAAASEPAWRFSQPVSDPVAKVQSDLDLGPLHVGEGDVILVTGVAADSYALGDARHPRSESPVRRLRVIGEMDFAAQLRRQLSAVRQNAIRIEALQAELQDDVTESGVQPGMNRSQAQLSERIAAQRASVEEAERQLQQNRLDDQQLSDLLQQTHDLLDHAGRAANKAVEGLEKASAGKADDRKTDSGGARPDAGAKASSEAKGGGDASKNESKTDDSKAQASEAAKPAKPGGKTDESKPSSSQPSSTAPASHEAKPEDKPIVEAQQEVRDELSDLIKLLDRDEDTWVVKRQLEDLLQKQKALTDRTKALGQKTMGQLPENLPEPERSELDRIIQQQKDLADEARKATDDLRERSKGLEKADPQSAESMRNAASTAEQQQLDRDMEEAAKKAQQNQMTSAQASQEQAQSTLQKMLKDIQENKRAVAQQLIRQLASLVESITRLINVQENEIAALKLANDTKDYNGLDRSMIRLNQNTQSVAGEARAAGNEARRIARSLDRAADAQGAAVAAFRAQPVDPAAAEEGENHSLELLKEAKALAEDLQKKTESQELQKRREELMAAYRAFAEQEVAVRVDTLKLVSPEPLDRRQLVEARRLGGRQGEIRTGLNDLKTQTSEIMDSPIFLHVHKAIDGWSAAATDALVAGTVSIDVTDRQQQIADSIGRLIQALEESNRPPDEFTQEQQNQQNQQQQQGDQQGQQPLIPPVAQLKLLQGLQEQVYNLTREIDSRTDLDEAQKRNRLRDIGQQQRDLMDLGRQMLEDLQKQQPVKPDAEKPQEPGGPEKPVPPTPSDAQPDQPEERNQPKSPDSPNPSADVTGN